MSQLPPSSGSEQDLETQQLPLRSQEQPLDACPRCQQPWQEGSRFCQSCGLPLDADTPADAHSTLAAAFDQAEEPRQRAWLPVVTVLWLVIMLVGLYFIYSRAIVVGGS